MQLRVEFTKFNYDEKVFLNPYARLTTNHQSIYIYIYIYKSRDLMQESMRFYYVAHSIKRVEILLSHIRDKNKFKNRDSLFLLVQCFKTFLIKK